MTAPNSRAVHTSHSSHLKSGVTGWMFVAPFLIIFAFVFIVPLIYSLVISLFGHQLLGGTKFVGMSNYVKLFKDPLLWEGIGRVLLFTAIQVPLMLIISICLALAIDSGRLYGTKFSRISIFIPYAVPGVISTLMWGFLLGTRYGLFKTFNELFHSSINPFSPQFIMVSIGIMISWASIGYNMLIFYSSLKSIPPELYEAAIIDGATQGQIDWYIKIPEIRGSLAITLIFSIIGSVQLFNEPQILSKMMSGTGITSSWTPNLYIYNLAFGDSSQGYAAAAALIMALIVIVITFIIQIRNMRKTVTE
ncbi:MAG: sugar ABC transporter permease [Aeriscardovia aeriphila]|nr:sugar ABC transporter permease [Aeriscardovia aeriphila]